MNAAWVGDDLRIGRSSGRGWYHRHLAPLHAESAQKAVSAVLLLMFATMTTWISAAYAAFGSTTMLTAAPMEGAGMLFVVIGMPLSLLVSGLLVRHVAVPTVFLGLPFVTFFVLVGVGGALSGQVNGAGSQAPNILVAVYAAYQLPRLAAWIASGLCIASTVLNNLVLAPDASGVANVVLVAFVFLATTTVMTHLRAGHDELEDELSRRLHVDALTGVATRRVLESRFAELRTSTARSDGCSLVLVDVDHLKRVNDTHGHPAGDALIRHVCEALTTAAPRGAVVCRIGGDELAVLLPDTSVAAGEAAARLMLAAVGADPLDLCDDTSMRASVSMGLGHVDDSADVDSLYQRADASLYEAKRQGRGCLVTTRGGCIRSSYSG